MSEANITYDESSGSKTARIEVLQGHVGLTDSGNLSEIVDEAISNGAKDFVLNLSALSTLNSAGIGIMIACRKRILENGGKLNLENVSSKVTEVFKLTRIDSLFGISG